jgi:hypothetical protein
MSNLIQSTVEAILAQYRGPSNSENINKFFRQSYNDIYSMIRRSNEYIEDYNISTIVNQQNSDSFGSQIADLINEIDSIVLTNKLVYSYTDDTKISYGDVGGLDIIGIDEQAEVDKQYGQLIPHKTRAPISKLHIYDPLTGSTVVGENILTIMNTTTGYKLKELDPNNIIDGDISTYYYRIVGYSPSSPVTSEELDLEILVPRNLINTLDANYIEVLPFPEYMVDIINVTCIDITGVSSTIVDEFVNPILNSGKQRFIFNDITLDKIRIKLRSRHPDLKIYDGYKSFILGCNLIDVGYIKFADSSRILTKFHLETHQFKTITKILPENTLGVSYKLYYLDGSTLVAKNINENFPLNITDVYIETTISTLNNRLPILTYCGIEFTTWV